MASTVQQISKLELAAGQIVNIDKPEGWTSFDVVKKLRNTTGVKKVGHAGTLDPFATGVLLVCFGKATKSVNDLMELEKEYTGTLEFGVETDSHDIAGKILNTSPVPKITQENFDQNLQHYHGTILQRPPIFSALKQNGQRLYKLARAGKIVETKSRPVTIYSIEIVKMSLPEVDIKVACSRGTYIRALARDIGNDYGCGAYLKSLRRHRIGSHLAKESLQIDQFIKRIVD